MAVFVICRKKKDTRRKEGGEREILGLVALTCTFEYSCIVFDTPLNLTTVIPQYLSGIGSRASTVMKIHGGPSPLYKMAYNNAYNCLDSQS